MSRATRRLAVRQSEVSTARDEKHYLVRGGKAARDQRRAYARIERHIVSEALRRGDYETLEVL